MTGPGYVTAQPDGTYEPHCQAHEQMWRGPKTKALEPALEAAAAHNTETHGDAA